MARDLYHRINEAAAILPAAALSSAAPTYVATIDLLGYEGATVVFFLGACSASNLIMHLEESDTTTSGDFTDVAVGDLILPAGVTTNAVSVVTGDANGFKAIGYVGGKRYIRLQTTSGTMTGSIVAFVERGFARVGPTR